MTSQTIPSMSWSLEPLDGIPGARADLFVAALVRFGAVLRVDIGNREAGDALRRAAVDDHELAVLDLPAGHLGLHLDVRSALAISGVDPAGPQVGGLDDVRVGRDHRLGRRQRLFELGAVALAGERERG